MHLFNNILIPTDFSPAAWKAIQLGISLVGSRRSQLTLLHVFPYSAKFEKRRIHANNHDLKTIDTIKKEMDEFCQGLGVSKNVKVNAVILGGGVEKEIVHYLDENSFDLIIMGVNSNGMDNNPGSHLTNIIEKANAPVLVVPNKVVQKVPA